MKLTTICLLALPTLAISLPSTLISTTTSALEGRSNTGWIGIFDETDRQCTSKADQDGSSGRRTELANNECTTLPQDFARGGVNWGSPSHPFHTLKAYEDNDCKIEQLTITKGEWGDGGLKNGLFILKRDLTCKKHGCVWGSVRLS